MFSNSTHKKWIFKDEKELKHHREKANRDFIQRNSHKTPTTNEKEKANYFLTEEEERILIKYYEFRLIEFCKYFTPKLPNEVYGTAFHYMKRFYVHNSVMDYHPKEILVTCVYLSCKVEEFNVTIEQFVRNVKGDLEKAIQVILNYELVLMEKINYHLWVHNIYKPIEGLLIDLKTRSSLRDPERLRAGMDTMIDKLYLTDACALFTPSQLALAIILHSASRNKENLDEYVTTTLIRRDKDILLLLIETIRKIRTLLTITDGFTPPSKEQIKQIEIKLLDCRCEENNPNSEIFKKMSEDLRKKQEWEETTWKW